MFEVSVLKDWKSKYALDKSLDISFGKFLDKEYSDLKDLDFSKFKDVVNKFEYNIVIIGDEYVGKT